MRGSTPTHIQLVDNHHCCSLYIVYNYRHSVCVYIIYVGWTGHVLAHDCLNLASQTPAEKTEQHFTYIWGQVKSSSSSSSLLKQWNVCHKLYSCPHCTATLLTYGIFTNPPPYIIMWGCSNNYDTYLQSPRCRNEVCMIKCLYTCIHEFTGCIRSQGYTQG